MKREEAKKEMLKEIKNKTKKKKKESKIIRFNYDFVKSNIKTIDSLKEFIEEYFPNSWFETSACLGLFASMSLKNLNGCPSLVLIGSPASEKTTDLSFFYGHDLAYLSDDFTPKAFVSHSANVKEEKLKDVDLLPKITNKVLISPELAPLFEAPKDKLLDNFSILTRVLDGEGLNRDTGVYGHRGYSGDYKFGWLGASTPLRASVWNIMGKIGNRMFFLYVREKNRKDKEFIEMFRGKAYEERVKLCRGAIKSFLDEHFNKFPVRSVEWDAEQDLLILEEIVKYAKFLSKLRGTLMLWKSEGTEKYEHSFPIIEEPPRAINSLYNFAKGNALIHNRTYLTKEDLEIVRAVTFSSMPHDRFEFLKLLAKYEGKLSTFQLLNELKCSDETARKTMKIFETLGVVSVKSLEVGHGRPMDYVEIEEDFKNILSHTQVRNSLEKSFPTKINSMCDDVEIIKIKNKEFVKAKER